MLYRAEAFEPLTDEAWDSERVRAAVREIAADTGAAFDPKALWPADEWDAWTSPLPLKNLYVGAAGVIWALDALERRGHAETALDVAAAARRTLEAWRAEPDFPAGIDLPEQRSAALLNGSSARAAAGHALRQVERRVRGRYSLWTGDLGAALFGADCLDVPTAYPVLETWD